MKIFSVEKYKEWHKKEYGVEADLVTFKWPLDCDGQPYNEDNTVIGKSGKTFMGGLGSEEWYVEVEESV